MDPENWNWFLAGIFLGTFLEKMTVVLMILIWMIMNNYSLPPALGGQPVQDVIRHGFLLGMEKLTRISNSQNVP